MEQPCSSRDSPAEEDTTGVMVTGKLMNGPPNEHDAPLAQGRTPKLLDGKLALKDQGVFSSKILSLRYGIAIDCFHCVLLQATSGPPRETAPHTSGCAPLGPVPPVLAECGTRQSTLHGQ